MKTLFSVLFLTLLAGAPASAAAPAPVGGRGQADCAFLSAMLAEYEGAAAATDRAIDIHESIIWQNMAAERAQSLARFSEEITYLMRIKGCVITAASGVKRLYPPPGPELLDELAGRFHRTAAAALENLRRTDDADVADLADEIIGDQAKALANTKRIPDALRAEQSLYKRNAAQE